MFNVQVKYRNMTRRGLQLSEICIAASLIKQQHVAVLSAVRLQAVDLITRIQIISNGPKALSKLKVP